MPCTLCLDASQSPRCGRTRRTSVGAAAWHPRFVCGLHVHSYAAVNAQHRFQKHGPSDFFKWIQNSHVSQCISVSNSFHSRTDNMLLSLFFFFWSQGREPQHLLRHRSWNTDTCAVVLSFPVLPPWPGSFSPLTWEEIIPLDAAKFNSLNTMPSASAQTCPAQIDHQSMCAGGGGGGGLLEGVTSPEGRQIDTRSMWPNSGSRRSHCASVCSLASLQCQDAGLVPSSCDLELPGKSVCHRVAKKKNLGLVNNWGVPGGSVDLLWRGSHLWSWNSCIPRALPKKGENSSESEWLMS